MGGGDIEVDGSAANAWPETRDVLETGSIVADQFLVKRCLGQGILGTVYLVEDTLTHQRLALKMIDPAVLQDRTMEARLARNIEVARGVRHPGIAPVFDARRTGPCFFYTMPYVEAHPLRRFLEQYKTLSFRKAVGLIHRVGLILEYGHRTMPHKNLTPENIMIFPDASIVLMDYGLWPDGYAPEELPANRCFYVAPEQYAGQPATTSGDVYALGVILFETLAGAPPPGCGRLPDLRPDVPPSVDAVVARALAPPEIRYRSVRAFRRAVERYCPRQIQRAPEAEHPPEPGADALPAYSGRRDRTLVHSSQERAWHEWELQLERIRIQESSTRKPPAIEGVGAWLRNHWRRPI